MLLGRGVAAGDPGEADEWELCGVEVAQDDGALIVLLPGVDEDVGEGGGHGVISAGADEDSKELGRDAVVLGDLGLGRC